MTVKLKDNSHSFALCQGFFCRTEDEFDDWCMRIRRVCFHSFIHLLGSSHWAETIFAKCPFSIQLSCNKDNLPMFELIDSQPSHLVGVDAINLTPGEKTNSLPNAPPLFFNTSFLPLITTQISQTQKGWNGSLTQKTRSLRSSPCEEGWWFPVQMQKASLLN